MDRLQHLREFYGLLDELEHRLGGKRVLSECSGRLAWPARGIYFFFEPGETRSDSGNGSRVVRVGTHALNEGAQSTLWQRLGQHRGQVQGGGGNHRGSIFRLLIGTALRHRTEFAGIASWGVKGDAGLAALQLNTNRADIRAREHALERAVTQYVGGMPFLWLEIDDLPSPESDRGRLERNSIALLSNYGEEPALDPASPRWLGSLCDRERVRKSGLWNNNHVDEVYEPGFLTTIAGYVRQP